MEHTVVINSNQGNVLRDYCDDDELLEEEVYVDDSVYLQDILQDLTDVDDMYVSNDDKQLKDFLDELDEEHAERTFEIIQPSAAVPSSSLPLCYEISSYAQEFEDIDFNQHTNLSLPIYSPSVEIAPSHPSYLHSDIKVTPTASPSLLEIQEISSSPPSSSPASESEDVIVRETSLLKSPHDTRTYHSYDISKDPN